MNYLLAAERVIRHGPAAFQTYTFTSRLLQRTVDMRHVCFLNVSIDSKRIPLYIDIVSKPYKKVHFEYYQNDKQTILVEYNEDIGNWNKFFEKLHFSFLVLKILPKFPRMYEAILKIMDYK